LLGYSPFNNIKDDVNYPTTLIITSENDDRVAPAHSYKFAAKLQNRSAQKNPIYLKTLQHSGHSGSTGRYADSINEEADFYNFLLYHLNE
jgi:prolyl oligopeptidase